MSGLWGLLGLPIAGLATLAFKDPRTFLWLSKYLARGAYCLTALVAVWFAAIESAQMAAFSAVMDIAKGKPEISNAAHVAADAVRELSSWWVWGLLGIVTFLLYLGFLEAIVWFRQRSAEEQNQTPDQPST